MKIEDIEFPDECPPDCRFEDDFGNYGQSAICGRCPVFVCKEPDPLVPAEGYRLDWAKEWKRFFDGETDFPQLRL